MAEKREIKELYIPLKVEPLGEGHKLATLLTEEHGILRVAVFRAATKKGGALRSLIEPFSLCRGELFHDPVKKWWRLSDGELIFHSDAYHNNLKKMYCALFWSELSIKSYGGAGHGDLFPLSQRVFSQLAKEQDGEEELILFEAIWSFLTTEGVAPDLDHCSICFRKAPPLKAVCYNQGGHILCSHCRLGELPILSKEARQFLKTFSSLAKSERQGLMAYLLFILKDLFYFNFSSFFIDLILKN